MIAPGGHIVVAAFAFLTGTAAAVITENHGAGRSPLEDEGWGVTLFSSSRGLSELSPGRRGGLEDQGAAFERGVLDIHMKLD